MTEASEAAAIAAGLTEAQRRALATHDERVHSRRDIHQRTWASLYKKGLASHMQAAGHLFFNWTPLGLAVRAHLLGEAS